MYVHTFGILPTDQDPFNVGLHGNILVMAIIRRHLHVYHDFYSYPLRFEPDEWNSDGHYGLCGRTCPCCRAEDWENTRDRGMIIGACILCVTCVPFAEKLYKQLLEYSNQDWDCSELTRMTLTRIPSADNRFHAIFQGALFRNILVHLGRIADPDSKTGVGTISMEAGHLMREALYKVHASSYERFERCRHCIA